MEVCMGMIGWTPTQFWNATLHEIIPAIDGFIEFNGGGKETPMTNEELKDLMELYPD
jgi:hypothetical protein